jgi:phosphoribosylamine-glycine ligase
MLSGSKSVSIVPLSKFHVQAKMESRSTLRILLVGNGGRESALAFKLSQSPRVEKIFVVPGNGGTAKGNEKVSNISGVGGEGFPGLVKLAKELQVNLVVPGERPILHRV